MVQLQLAQQSVLHSSKRRSRGLATPDQNPQISTCMVRPSPSICSMHLDNQLIVAVLDRAALVLAFECFLRIRRYVC